VAAQEGGLVSYRSSKRGARGHRRVSTPSRYSESKMRRELRAANDALERELDAEADECTCRCAHLYEGECTDQCSPYG